MRWLKAHGHALLGIALEVTAVASLTAFGYVVWKPATLLIFGVAALAAAWRFSR